MGAANANAAHGRHHHCRPAPAAVTAPLHPVLQSNVGKRKHEPAGNQPYEPQLKKINTLYHDNFNTSHATGCIDFAPEHWFSGASHTDAIHFTHVHSSPDDEFGNIDFDLDGLDLDGLLHPAGGTTQFTDPPSPDEDLFSQFISLSPLPEPKQPPSSVIREFYAVSNTVSPSTTATQFDPNLQYSPPYSASSALEDKPDHEANLLDDMSWHNLESHIDEFSANQLLESKNEHEIFQSKNVQTRTPAQQTTPSSTESSVSPRMMLRPYKTWFHIREMLEAKTSMYKNQQNAKFELFARVVYTCRENFGRKQLFQLRDLFKVNPPYLPGVLLNWQSGDSVDIAAQEFLKRKDPAVKCYCVCTLQADIRSELGYSVVLEKIRATTWKEIMAVMDHLGRNDLDDAQLCSQM